MEFPIICYSEMQQSGPDRTDGLVRSSVPIIHCRSGPVWKNFHGTGLSGWHDTKNQTYTFITRNLVQNLTVSHIMIKQFVYYLQRILVIVNTFCLLAVDSCIF